MKELGVSDAIFDEAENLFAPEGEKEKLVNDENSHKESEKITQSAIKIQSSFRGHQTRTALADASAKNTTDDDKEVKETKTKVSQSAAAKQEAVGKHKTNEGDDQTSTATGKDVASVGPVLTLKNAKRLIHRERRLRFQAQEAKSLAEKEKKEIYIQLEKFKEKIKQMGAPHLRGRLRAEKESKRAKEELSTVMTQYDELSQNFQQLQEQNMHLQSKCRELSAKYKASVHAKKNQPQQSTISPGVELRYRNKIKALQKRNKDLIVESNKQLSLAMEGEKRAIAAFSSAMEELRNKTEELNRTKLMIEDLHNVIDGQKFQLTVGFQSPRHLRVASPPRSYSPPHHHFLNKKQHNHHLDRHQPNRNAPPKKQLRRPRHEEISPTKNRKGITKVEAKVMQKRHQLEKKNMQVIRQRARRHPRGKHGKQSKIPKPKVYHQQPLPNLVSESPQQTFKMDFGDVDTNSGWGYNLLDGII
eukprot:g3277.t1